MTEPNTHETRELIVAAQLVLDFEKQFKAEADSTCLQAQWMPIEEAPRDATFVDLWCKRVHCHGKEEYVRKCNCSWGSIDDQFTSKIYKGWRGIGETYAQNTPTHFMPIPKPPSGVMEDMFDKALDRLELALERVK